MGPVELVALQVQDESVIILRDQISWFEIMEYFGRRGCFISLS